MTFAGTALPVRGLPRFSMLRDPLGKWWMHVPERPWPLWVYLLDAALIAISSYLFAVYGGLLGFVLGLMVLFVALPLFFTWQWMSWRASRTRR